MQAGHCGIPTAGQSSSLQQDSRKARLAIRFRAAMPGLESRWGFTGATNLVHAKDLSAVGIKQGTLRILEELAAPSGFAQGARSGRKAIPGLVDHIRAHVELYNADGVYEEQLLGELLSKGDLPKLLVHNRDTAHEARRTVVGHEVCEG